MRYNQKKKEGMLLVMFESIKISPSLLSADFMNMEDSIRLIEDAGAAFAHVDVMDGHFVPNLTLGVPFVAQLKKITKLPLDVHLMIDNPLEQLPWFLEAGADWVTVHIEALDGVSEVTRALDMIRAAGAHPALALKPGTAVAMVEPYVALVDMVLVMSVNPGFSGQGYIEGTEDRVAEVVGFARAAGASPLIQVDGGIGLTTAGRVAAAGADVLVAGNAVYKAEDPKAAVAAITQAALEGRA